MSENISCMYKGVFVHQLSSLNICFTTLLMKMNSAYAVSITAPHALPFIRFIIFKNYKNITSFQFPFWISTVTAVIFIYLKEDYKFMD